MTAIVPVSQWPLGSLLLLELMTGATALLLIAAGAVLLLRKQSAALRHRVWTLSMGGLLVLPVLAALMPNWGPQWQPQSGSGSGEALALVADDRMIRPESPATIPVSGSIDSGKFRPIPAGQSEPVSDGPGRRAEPEFAGHTADPDPENRAATSRADTAERTSISREIPAPTHGVIQKLVRGAVVVWLSGVLIGALSLMRSLFLTCRFVRRAMPVTDDDVEEIGARLGQLAGVNRAVPVFCSAEIAVPLTVGTWRPVLLLPTGFGQWSAERLRVVLAHELAHIARRDVLWQLISRLACCLYWSHPLVWLANWRMRIEREFACDDAVLTMGEVADRYATHLVDVADGLRERANPSLAAVAMASRSSLEQRVRAIVHPAIKRAPVTGRTGRLLIAGTFAVVLTLSLMVPSTSQNAGAEIDDRPASATADGGSSTKSDASTGKASPPDRAEVMSKDGSVPTKGHMRIRAVGPADEPLPGTTLLVNVGTNEPFDGLQNYECDKDGWADVKLPETLSLLRIWARKESYVPLFAQWWPKEQTNGHLIPEEFTFELQKGTVIGGVVRNEAGRPIEGAAVEVKYEFEEDINERVRPDTWLANGDGARIADAEGRWTLNNVPSGDNVGLRVKLSHPDYIDDETWGGLQREQLVTLESLRDQTAVIVMKRGITVSGTVTDPEGKPVPNAVVIWGDRPYWQEGSQEVRTDEQGTYQFPPLSAGPMNITVVAEGWRPELRKVDIQAGMPAVNLQLQVGQPLHLRLVDPSGKPVADAYVAVERWRGAESLYNHNIPTCWKPGSPGRAMRTDSISGGGLRTMR